MGNHPEGYGKVQVNIGAGLDYVPDIKAAIQWENTLCTKNHKLVFFRYHFKT